MHEFKTIVLLFFLSPLLLIWMILLALLIWPGNPRWDEFKEVYRNVLESGGWF